MELRRRTPAEVRAYLESSPDLVRLLPNAEERRAFVEETVAAAEHPRERIPVPDPARRDRWAPYDGPPQ